MKIAERKPMAYGYIAQFSEAEQLVTAAQRTRDAGYEKVDAFSPYAIEGLAEVLKQKDDRVPWIVFICGMTGASLGFLLQYYVTFIDFPLNIGGRPNFSWPSFIPITFECGVLAAAFGAVIGMLVLNGLPKPYHPVFNVPEFDSATDDKFFLLVEADDPNFEKENTRNFLATLGPEKVTEVPA